MSRFRCQSCGNNMCDHSSPLHCALDMEGSDEVVLTLLKAHEDAAKEKHIDGNLPLHYALEVKRSNEVILAFLKAHEDAAKKKNIHGFLPLHHALQLERSEDIVSALLVSYKKASQLSFLDGDCKFLPLHKALDKKYSDKLLLAILSAYKSAVMIKCPYLPLHHAVTSSSSASFIETLIRKYPQALDEKGDTGSPRDLVDSSLSPEAIKMLCTPTSEWVELVQKESKGLESDNIDVILNQAGDQSNIMDSMNHNFERMLAASEERLERILLSSEEKLQRMLAASEERFERVMLNNSKSPVQVDLSLMEEKLSKIMMDQDILHSQADDRSKSIGTMIANLMHLLVLPKENTEHDVLKDSTLPVQVDLSQIEEKVSKIITDQEAPANRLAEIEAKNASPNTLEGLASTTELMK